ncbi:carnitine dehydratase [Microbacterium sp. Root61]|uniref:CaiB/BaiF CoA transferase family protein n=1 Tax=Microbacterium sp. Root61 TaxID=1736570 RepID=UPI0006F49AEF|nr:CaiB/BaiF CoA-transferase family protein [Microbacterium sp. Root61]KRA26081.1 carnitine dehydratase [Microbacterium sp. Root61]
MSGPLEGITVVELGGIGPTPFCGMMLSDLGASVTVIARAGRSQHPILDRGKTVVSANLKDEADAARVRALIASADAVIEGFRPGVAERLGFGPEDVAGWNPAIVYGRITGFGRTGPLALRAGHDINYVALSGALGVMGPKDGPPVPALNLVADFGGGGLLLALGVVSALLRSRVTGEGEVVDTAMVDGSALLMSMIYGFHALGRWSTERGTNLLDGGAPYYQTYECADGRHIAVGALEPEFFLTLVHGLGLREQVDVSRQDDRRYWPELRDLLEHAFLTRPRDHWAALFADVDACVTPVLAVDETAHHPHNAARATFTPIPGGMAPAPSPHFAPLPQTLTPILETSPR